MAQAGFTPISLYYSTTASAVPSSGNLVAGELALNTVDEKLYFKNSAGTVKLLASNATSAPVLSFSAGTTGFTPNTATTGAVTLAGTLATTNGGTGLTSFTANGVVYASSSSALATGSGLVFNGTNLGVGVTPSAYNAGKVIEVGTVGNAVFGIGAADMRIISGAYYNSGSGGWIYTASGTAISNYGQTAGSHLWYTAPSGTAGNLVSFTQAMTLDASGNLGVGITSPTARFHIQSATTGSVIVGKWTDGVTDTGYLTTVTGGGAGVGAGGFLTFGAGGGASFTERARIDSSGNFGIGTTSNTAGYKLDVRGNVIAYTASGNVSVVVQTGTDANGAMNAVAGIGLGFNTDATNRNITFSTNSVERFRFGASGQFGIGGANYGLAGQVLTSGGSGAAPTWATPAGGGSQAFVAFGANGGF